MGVYRIEVTIHATAYVRADSEADAVKMAKEIEGNGMELRENRDADIPISGQHFDSCELPELSLSPAMTIGKIAAGSIELVED